MKRKILVLIIAIISGVLFLTNVNAEDVSVPTPNLISVTKLTDTSVTIKYKLDSCTLNNCGIMVMNETWLKEKKNGSIILRSKKDEEYVWQNLEKGKTYNFYVAVYWFDSDGKLNNGKWSGPKSINTPLTGLANVNTTISDYETVAINYNAGSDVKSVKVTNLSVSPNKTVTDTAKNGVKFTKLTPGNTYKFKIVPVLTNGQNGTATEKTVSLKLGNASFNTLSRNSYNKVNMGYSKPKQASGVQIENMTTGKRAYFTNSSNATWTGLTYDKTYKFRVRSYYKASTGKYYYGPWTSSKSITVKLQMPTNFSVTSTEPGKVVFTYTLKDPSTGVEIYNNNTSSSIKRAYKSKTSISNLTKGKTYNFKIRTYYKTSSGKYYYSYYTDLKSVKVASVVNKEPTNPVEATLPVPTAVTVSRVDYNKIKVGYTISDPAKVDGVEIYNTTSGVTRTGITNKTYYDYDKLTYDKSYSFKVRTYKTENSVKKYSAWSVVSKEIVAKLPTISNLTGEDTGSGGAKFKYSVLGSTTGVELQDITTSKDTGPKKKTTYKNSVTWTGLSNGLHKFRIRSYYEVGSKTYYSYWSTSFSNQSDGIPVTITGNKVTCTLKFTNASSSSINWCTTTSLINVTGTCTSLTSTIKKDDIHINCGDDKCLTSIEKTGGKTAKITAKISNANGSKDKKRFSIKVYATDGLNGKGSITKVAGFKNCDERMEYWQ